MRGGAGELRLGGEKGRAVSDTLSHVPACALSWLGNCSLRPRRQSRMSLCHFLRGGRTETLFQIKLRDRGSPEGMEKKHR